MKTLVHRHRRGTNPPFNLTSIKAALRVAFDDDDLTIEEKSHATARELEHFAQIALLSQTIFVTIIDLDHFGDVHLPIGPAMKSHPITVKVEGAPFTDFKVIHAFRPILRWTEPGNALLHSTVEIKYRAGFGYHANHIPADLSEALASQVQLHFDGLDGLGGRVDFGLSPHMARLTARYRGVSV